MTDGGKTARLMRDVIKDPALLAEKRRELDTLRTEHAKEWALNREFYNGNQWILWNKYSASVDTLGVEETDRPRWKVRLTDNRILPGVTQLVAQMTKTRPVIHATPNSGADRDIKAAQMAERLYEFWWDELGLRAKLTSALVHAQISQGYWLITWDALAGKEMKVMVNPETGAPIWDDEEADIYREELRAAAEEFGIPGQELIDQFEQVVYMGDVRVQVLDGMQVWLDPTASSFEDCEYAICKFPMTVDEIATRYGEEVTPDATSVDRKPTLYGTQMSDDMPKNVRNVYHLYHRPVPHLPKGRYVCWIEGPHKILYQSDWQFPFNTLNLVKFPGIERPGSVYDETRVKHARPLQKELNDIVSGVAMHRRLTMKPQMLAPTGSLRQRLTDEPGAVWEYNPVAGLAPQWREMPGLPSYVWQSLEGTQASLARIFNLLPTERGQLPARTDSGQLVELVQEAVADQISPEIQRMEDALAQAGGILAALAQEYYEEPRLLKIKGPGGSVQAIKFQNVDLGGGYSFRAEAGSGLPRTRAGQIQQIKEMVEMQAMDIREAVQYLPIAGLKGVQARIAADEDFAQRKVEKLLKGLPINLPEMEQAIQHVQMYGTDPNTGEFFTSPEEAVAFVEQAALTPLPFENAQVSAHVLGLHMKSVEFERYPVEVQSRFYQHLQMLQSALGEPQPQEAIRTTLSLNGTVGPTVAAAILQQKGIAEATPQTMQEPPLETSVYDSMDKADVDSAGNDPLEEEERLMAMAQAQATADLKQARAANEIANAQDKHVQSIRQADEMHQERIRQARQPRGT